MKHPTSIVLHTKYPSRCIVAWKFQGKSVVLDGCVDLFQGGHLFAILLLDAVARPGCNHLLSSLLASDEAHSSICLEDKCLMRNRQPYAAGLPGRNRG
jgi:hypothetical protein